MDRFEKIEISLGDPKTRGEIMEALQLIARDIDSGCYSGIVGWSDVSWSIKRSDDESEDE